MRSSIAADETGSRFAVGSSRRRRSGPVTIARARATRCISPPESVTAFLLPKPDSPTRSRASFIVFMLSREYCPRNFRPNATFSDTVVLSTTGFWKTMPIRRRSAILTDSAAFVSVPSKTSRPAEGRSSRSMRRISVVFPLPLGPIRVKISPFLMVRSIPSRSVRPPATRESPTHSIIPVAHPRQSVRPCLRPPR